MLRFTKLWLMQRNISRPAEPAAEAKTDDAQLDEPKAKEERQPPRQIASSRQ